MLINQGCVKSQVFLCNFCIISYQDPAFYLQIPDHDRDPRSSVTKTLVMVLSTPCLETILAFGKTAGLRTPLRYKGSRQEPPDSTFNCDSFLITVFAGNILFAKVICIKFLNLPVLLHLACK